MTTIEHIDKLIEYYTKDKEDFTRRIEDERDDYQDYYEGRIEQLNEVLNDLQMLKKLAMKNHD